MKRSSGPPSISRRQALGVLGASAVGVLSGRAVHPLVPVQEGEEWRPRFFDSDQLALVADLAETIVPETDTPGARAALVHQYVDWVLSQADEDEQGRFVEGLAWIERRGRARHSKSFGQLSSSDRHALLAEIAEAAESPAESASSREEIDEARLAWFRELKAHTIRGYYRSEVGMRQELEYRGNAYLREFEGCRHPEHLEWEPSSPNDEPGR